MSPLSKEQQTPLTPPKAPATPTAPLDTLMKLDEAFKYAITQALPNRNLRDRLLRQSSKMDAVIKILSDDTYRYATCQSIFTKLFQQEGIQDLFISFIKSQEPDKQARTIKALIYISASKEISPQTIPIIKGVISDHTPLLACCKKLYGDSPLSITHASAGIKNILLSLDSDEEKKQLANIFSRNPGDLKLFLTVLDDKSIKPVLDGFFNSKTPEIWQQMFIGFFDLIPTQELYSSVVKNAKKILGKIVLGKDKIAFILDNEKTLSAVLKLSYHKELYQNARIILEHLIEYGPQILATTYLTKNSDDQKLFLNTLLWIIKPSTNQETKQPKVCQIILQLASSHKHSDIINLLSKTPPSYDTTLKQVLSKILETTTELQPWLIAITNHLCARNHEKKEVFIDALSTINRPTTVDITGFDLTSAPGIFEELLDRACPK